LLHADYGCTSIKATNCNLRFGKDDIRDYINWIWSPSKTLISDTTIASHFKAKASTDIRTVNETWIPFFIRQSKTNCITNLLILLKGSAIDKPKSRFSLNQTA
jgi:hypothetical protein